MSYFFEVSYDEDMVRDSGVSRYINNSGIYPITIDAAFLKKSKNGSLAVSLLITHEGQQQILFDAIRLTNNDGKDNNQRALLNKLCIIAGIERLKNTIKENLPIGKDQAEEECDIFAELCGIDVYARIQMEYGRYEGKIQPRKHLRTFFRAEDFATASEILNKLPAKEDDGSTQEAYIGKQYERELKDADKTIYSNDVTKEEIDEWIKNGRGANKENKETSTPKAAFKGSGRFSKK